MGLAKASQAAASPKPKLRRTKTFADLLRRPEPMTSLRGIEVERLAYLGGRDFLVLPGVMPCPVELPNCIVKSIKYLRKIGECPFRPMFCLDVITGLTNDETL